MATIGETSVTIGWDTIIENNDIFTQGWTIGINTGLLVAVICWAYQFITTGNPTWMPGLVS